MWVKLSHWITSLVMLVNDFVRFSCASWYRQETIKTLELTQWIIMLIGIH